MIRKDKEIVDNDVIAKIIMNSLVCKLGLSKDNSPYVIPISFGYDGQAIFFHTALKGQKLDYIDANPEVCFEFEQGVKVLTDKENACSFTMSFQSVIGFGNVQELTGDKDKTDGLNVIMKHYTGKEWTFPEEKLTTIRVWKINIKSISGKQSKDYLNLTQAV